MASLEGICQIDAANCLSIQAVAVLVLLVALVSCLLGFSYSSTSTSTGASSGPAAAALAEAPHTQAKPKTAVRHGTATLHADSYLRVEVSNVLGWGTSSTVFKGTWQGAPVAVKVVRVPVPLGQSLANEPLKRIVSHPNLVHLYAYNEAVVTAKTGYVSGSLRSFGKDIGISLGQAVQIAGACPASYTVCQQERDGAGQDMLEVVMVTELCRNGTLRDHIDVQASLKAAAAASCESCCSGSSCSCSCCDDQPTQPPPLSPGSPAPSLAGDGNAACPCAECQERASLQQHQQQQPMRWSVALPDLAFASEDDGRLLSAQDLGMQPKSMAPACLSYTNCELALSIKSLLEVGRGLAFLHHRGIAHGKLTSSNVVLKTSNEDRRGFTAKIAFWGLQTATAQSWGPGEDVENPVRSGASALQQLRLATYEDVYAFGAIMVEIVTGKLPERCSVTGRPHLADLKALRVPPAYKLLVKQCLAANAAFRPSMSEVVYSLNVLSEQLREVSMVSELDMLFSIVNGRAPAAPLHSPKQDSSVHALLRSKSEREGPAQRRRAGALHEHLAGIDALFSRSLSLPSGSLARQLLHQPPPACQPSVSSVPTTILHQPPPACLPSVPSVPTTKPLSPLREAPSGLPQR